MSYMSEEKLTKILQVLNKIDSKLDKLDDLISIMKMGQRNTIEQTKVELLTKSPFRHEVYKLCDGQHSVSDIAEAVDKSISQVSQAISPLMSSGLIAEQRRGKTKYYVKVI